MLKAEPEPAAHVELGAGAVAMVRLDKVNCTVPSPTPKTKEEGNKILSWKGTKTQLALKPSRTLLLCSILKAITILMTLGCKNSALWLSVSYPCQ